MLDICLFTFRGLARPVVRNKQSNTPTLKIYYTFVSVQRVHVPSMHTTEMYKYHLRGYYSCICFCLQL